MNINPISFGSVIRVVGNQPKKAAKEIKSFINNEANGIALVETFCKDSAFVVTGKDAEKLYELRQEKKKMVEAAKQKYGKDNTMVEYVKTNEQDRYDDLAKCIISNADIVSIDTTFDNEEKKLSSIYILG